MSSKKPLIGIGLAAVAAIAYFLVTGWPPTGRNVADNVGGTIGAANRYTNQQITPEDVAVNESEIQALMQSDIFHKMINDENFRNVVLENQWKVVASEPGALEIIATPEAQAFFADEMSRQLINQGGLARADIQVAAKVLLENANYRPLVLDASAMAVMQGETFRTLVADARKAGWTPEQFQKQLTENARIMADLNRSIAYKSLSADAQGRVFADMALRPEMGKILMDANALQKLAELAKYNVENGRQNLVMSGRLATVLKTEIYDFGRSQSVQALWRSNPEAARAVFEDATLQRYAASNAVQRLASDDQLRAKYAQM